jgi:hypothetical protein
MGNRIMRTIRGLLLAAATFAGSSGAAHAASALVEAVTAHLYAGETAAAAAAAEARLAETPGDDEARFALGAVQFIQAIESLGQAIHRYGIAGGGPQRSGIARMLPFFRIPVPANPAPEKIDYDALRAVLETLARDLARAEETLAGIGSVDLDLPLDIGRVRLDLNGDRSGDNEEALWSILQQVARLPQRQDDAADRLLTDFDGSDVPWLQGYCHLLMAISEFLLAHDWEAAFEATFHGVFPSAELPMSRADAEGKPLAGEYGVLADLIAFVHLNHWPVAEPNRMRRVLAHLEAVPPLSRENWRRVLAETDRRNEWLPNPKQTSVLGAPVTQEVIDGWLLFLDELEALLSGRKLLPHWRFDQGVNVRRIFEEPTTFDIVLLIQGSAAIPYLEDGEPTSPETWRGIVTLFRGNFIRYAIWFN